MSPGLYKWYEEESTLEDNRIFFFPIKTPKRFDYGTIYVVTKPNGNLMTMYISKMPVRPHELEYVKPADPKIIARFIRGNKGIVIRQYFERYS